MTEANSPTPLYYRVYAVMRERIVNGYYLEDAPLPSEAELSQSFTVSRITIRRAMALLTAEKLVTRARGKGTFVTPNAKDNQIGRQIVSDINGLLSYLNMVGQRTMLRVVNLDRGEAPPRICAQMGIAATSEVVRAIRIRDFDGAPYSLSKAYLLPEVGGKFTEKDLAEVAMIDLVRRAGSKVEQVEQILSATLADETASQHLEVPIGAPLMQVNRLFFNETLCPFYAAEILYRADRYEYRILLKRNAGKHFHLDAPQG